MKKLIQIFLKKSAASAFRRNTRPFIAANIAIIVISTALLSLDMIGTVYSYNAGDISSHTIKVPWEIIYTQKEQTEQDMKNARESVPVVFEIDPLVSSEKLRHANLLFQGLKSVADGSSTSSLSSTYIELQQLSNSLPEYQSLDKKTIDSVIGYASIDSLKKTTLKILSDIYDEGILDAAYSNPLNIPNDKYITKSTTDDSETVSAIKNISEIKTEAEIKADLLSRVRPYVLRYPQSQQSAVYQITRSMIKPNMYFNESEMKHALSNAEKSVKPAMAVLKKGQIIVREGDPITKEVLSKIELINKYTSRIHFNFVLGVVLIQMLFFMLIFLFLRNSTTFLASNIKMPVILLILVVSFIAYAYAFYQSQHNEESALRYTLMLPLPFIIMMFAFLYNTETVLVGLFYTMFFTSILTGGDYASLLIAVCSTLITLFAVRKVERRTDFLLMGLVIGLVNALLSVGIGLKDEYSFSEIISNVKISFIGGIANTIAVMGLFPMFESAFGVTSRFRLLELTDLNAQIFKRMLIKAPGTYNHSIMVANLAEAAAKEIGANHLLTKVGGYFHDIGKINNANIYIENRPDGAITDRDPAEYCREIIDHVSLGVETAKEEKLPNDVIDFISEHHGQSTMTFFYHQALEQAQKNGTGHLVNITDFQYLGPKPRSRETAIVMLADAIEAASRSISEPTYTKLEGLVKKIIHNKLNDGELESCDLTLKEIAKIQKAFIRVLAGIFHTRIEYPDKDDIKKLEKSIGK